MTRDLRFTEAQLQPPSDWRGVALGKESDINNSSGHRITIVVWCGHVLQLEEAIGWWDYGFLLVGDPTDNRTARNPSGFSPYKSDRARRQSAVATRRRRRERRRARRSRPAQNTKKGLSHDPPRCRSNSGVNETDVRRCFGAEGQEGGQLHGIGEGLVC